MLSLTLMICTQYMTTQLSSESPVPESRTLSDTERWSRPGSHFYTTLRNTFSHFSFAPDFSLISHSSTTSTPIHTLAERHCISKWNISEQIYYTLLHLYSTEACFFPPLPFSLSSLREIFWHLQCVILKLGFCTFVTLEQTRCSGRTWADLDLCISNSQLVFSSWKYTRTAFTCDLTIMNNS